VAEDYNLLSTWEAAMDDAGDITAADCKVFTINAETTAFIDGEAVTGGTSGATGVCIHQSATQILIGVIADGPFVAEQITGDTAGDITILDDGDSAIIVAHCYDDDGDLDDSVTIDGSTTDSSNYMKITVPEAERHNGTIASGFVLASTNATVITSSDDYTVIEWLIIEMTFSGRIDGAVGIRLRLNHTHLVQNCIIAAVSNSADGYSNDNTGISFPAETTAISHFKIYNNIIYGFNHTTDDWGGVYTGAAGFVSRNVTFDVYNNTIYNCDEPYDFANIDNGSASTFNCKNNIALGTGDVADFQWGTPQTEDIEYNAASDSTATDKDAVNSRDDVSTSDFESVVGGSEDLHLATGAVEIDQGIDLGTTANIDIDGRDRNAEGDTWDIGADEYVSEEEEARRIIFIM